VGCRPCIEGYLGLRRLGRRPSAAVTQELPAAAGQMCGAHAFATSKDETTAAPMRARRNRIAFS
jgi:hypothetical protein